jgi:glyoxylase-like metal-dependent hydrolase (beta-lactamase superfamily II)
MSPHITIQVFPSEPIGTNAVLVASSKAVVIDAPMGSFAHAQAFAAQHGLQIVGLFLTHTHWDHIVDAHLYKDHHIPISVHKDDAPNLETPGADGLPLFFPIQGVKPDHFLTDGEVVFSEGVPMRVIHTPGHSGGSVCFFLEKEKILISGDTLFRGTIGKLTFPTSRQDLMWSSLHKLSLLPPETRVIPGHGEETTIRDEPWLANAKKKFAPGT